MKHVARIDSKVMEKQYPFAWFSTGVTLTNVQINRSFDFELQQKGNASQIQLGNLGEACSNEIERNHRTTQAKGKRTLGV
jgi:hypothetical protein